MILTVAVVSLGIIAASPTPTMTATPTATRTMTKTPTVTRTIAKVVTASYKSQLTGVIITQRMVATAVAQKAQDVARYTRTSTATPTPTSTPTNTATPTATSGAIISIPKERG